MCISLSLQINGIIPVHVCPCRVGDVFEGGAGGGQKAGALRKELGDLERAEKCLDELILSSTAQLKQLTEYEDNQRYPCSSTCLCGALLDATIRETSKFLVLF